MAEEDWHMPIESYQYFIILLRVNQIFTFYHFIRVAAKLYIPILINRSQYNFARRYRAVAQHFNGTNIIKYNYGQSYTIFGFWLKMTYRGVC